MRVGADASAAGGGCKLLGGGQRVAARPLPARRGQVGIQIHVWRASDVPGIIFRPPAAGFGQIPARIDWQYVRVAQALV